MNRLGVPFLLLLAILAILAILALITPTTTSGGNLFSCFVSEQKTKAPAVVRENFDEAYHFELQAINNHADSQNDVQPVITHLKKRKIAQQVARLRDTWAQDEYYLLGFLQKLDIFKSYLPECDRVKFDDSILEKFYPHFSWNDESHHFTMRLEVPTGAHISIGYDLYSQPISDLCHLLDVLNVVLKKYFLEFTGMTSRSVLEKYLVGIFTVIYKLKTVSNPFKVKWDELLRLQLDAHSMRDFNNGCDEQDRSRAKNLEDAIAKVVKWIKKEEIEIDPITDLFNGEGDEGDTNQNAYRNMHLKARSATQSSAEALFSIGPD